MKKQDYEAPKLMSVDEVPIGHPVIRDLFKDNPFKIKQKEQLYGLNVDYNEKGELVKVPVGKKVFETYDLYDHDFDWIISQLWPEE